MLASWKTFGLGSAFALHTEGRCIEIKRHRDTYIENKKICNKQKNTVFFNKNWTWIKCSLILTYGIYFDVYTKPTKYQQQYIQLAESFSVSAAHQPSSVSIYTLYSVLVSPKAVFKSMEGASAHNEIFTVFICKSSLLVQSFRVWAVSPTYIVFSLSTFFF